jgi:excisionase family DNA binding protein
MTLQELPEFLTIREAAALINVHPNTLRNWEREGRLTATRVGSRRDRRFAQQDIWRIFQPT